MNYRTLGLKRWGGHKPRSSFALVSTLLLLTMLIAISTQLTTTVSIEAVVAGRRANDVAHELAVEGSLLVLADRLGETKNNQLIAELDRTGRAQFEYSAGSILVKCVIRDDGVKFNPLRFSAPSDRSRLERKLELLATRAHLPDVKVELQPILSETKADKSTSLYRWFDQLFGEVEPGELFRINEDEFSQSAAWSDAVTFWGDGRVDLRRASPDVLEAALEDIRPGLAKSIIAKRKQPPAINVLEQALVDVDAEIRQEVASRLTYDARRYAVSVETRVGADRRRWYVVVTINDKQTVLHHRSQILW